MTTYDYLIVGAGLFGSVFAYEAGKRGKRCLLVEKRGQLGGNCFCQNWDGITVHAYGAHIFHTDSKQIWDYVNAASGFNQYAHAVIANYQGELYNLPFNMNTFNRLWGVEKPEDALAKIALERGIYAGLEARNLEERALSLVGREIYEKLIKHYTEKQWGRPCLELPAFIINRLPLRFTFDNNYFNDPYQGIPQISYNDLFDFWLAGTDVRLNCDYLSERSELDSLAAKIVYTGPLDAYFGFRLGHLAYRSLRFEHERIERVNVQGCAVMNYTDADTAFTRVIEHRHFNPSLAAEATHSVVTREYPLALEQLTSGLGAAGAPESLAGNSGNCAALEPYYPINDAENNALFSRYRTLADKEKNRIFGGRLADYRYYDMDDTIKQALATVEAEFGG